ncbi:DUF883 family protein [Cobetia crustatorum]|uniref:DUF883 family protein n=1 Tax=Cobetia crustatorum TaxID=553385 RepID=UPI0004B9E139|nr:YqjD family protein [Cobetia crustatorum]
MAMQKIGDHTTSATNANTEQLKDDLRHLSQTVEDLIHASAEDSRDSMKEARARAQTRLEATRARLSEQGDRIAASARQSADCTDRYVHDNPWTSIGIGAAAGVVFGILLGRR